MIGLTLDSVKGLLEILSQRKNDEPVPAFGELDREKLSSALKTPFLRPESQNNNRSDQLETCALLFCLMVESHYAPNANKRLAVLSLLAILSLNGFSLLTTEVRLYAIAMAVAWMSKYQLFEQAVQEVFLFLQSETAVNTGENISLKEKSELEKEFLNFMGGS